MLYYGFCLPLYLYFHIIRFAGVSTLPNVSLKISGPAGGPEIPKAGLALALLMGRAASAMGCGMKPRAWGNGQGQAARVRVLAPLLLAVQLASHTSVSLAVRRG